jgi:hypothetical protein
MRNKTAERNGEAPERSEGELRARIRRDLERMGVAPGFSECVSGRLEASVAGLAPCEYGAVLSSVAAAYGERAVGDPADTTADDIADVQRLMQGFREEVQKLDEGLRMLSAYVARLRERGVRGRTESLH